jgi:molecular chaperone DnaK
MLTVFYPESARKETGVEQSVTIQGASNLNENEVDEMFEAEKYASADKEKRETIDLKNQAETLCLKQKRTFFQRKY